MVAFLDIGGTELLVILGAALVLLGPRRLPEIARQLGKVSAQLKDANRELKRELYSNLEPPPAGDGAASPGPPRPVARHREGDALAPAADYDAPYRDAEAESERARRPAALDGAGEQQPAPAAPAGAADNEKADPDESGSAS